jgi:hypothetical protein
MLCHQYYYFYKPPIEDKYDFAYTMKIKIMHKIQKQIQIKKIKVE